MIKEKLVKVKTVANYEETIKLLKAYVERSKSVLICSYEEQMDDEMCEIKVVCTRDYANVIVKILNIMAYSMLKKCKLVCELKPKSICLKIIS